MYCALRLNLPRRTKRRLPSRLRQPLDAPAALNRTWALDYMTDALYTGQRFRCLTILDEGNREGLAIEIGTSFPGPRLVRVLDELVALYGAPHALRPDNGPEFLLQALIDWCAAHGVAQHYIQPGKPRYPSSLTLRFSAIFQTPHSFPGGLTAARSRALSGGTTQVSRASAAVTQDSNAPDKESALLVASALRIERQLIAELRHEELRELVEKVAIAPGSFSVYWVSAALVLFKGLECATTHGLTRVESGDVGPRARRDAAPDRTRSFRPTLSLGRTLNRTATQMWGDVAPPLLGS